MARIPTKTALAGAWCCMLMAVPPTASAFNLIPPDLSSAGRTVTTDDGTWVPDAASYAYAWFRCSSTSVASCTQVPGATGSSYVLRTVDIGSRIRSRVSASGEPTPEFSDAVGPITASPPVNTARPVLTGTARVELALGTTTGTWSGRVAGDPPFRYQWQRCTLSSCANIPGSTSTTYLLGPQDVGRYIRPVVTAEGLGVAAALPTRLAGPVLNLPLEPAIPAARLRPFPVLAIAGRVRGRTTRLNYFVIRGPRRAKVNVRCRGRGCPFGRIAGTIGKSKRLRFRRAQRAFRAGQVLEVRVTGRDRIGKFTRITFRRGKAPRRVDSCLQPAASKPSRCPGA